MALATGTRLGLYEITAQLGAGGMGEVYRARDARLDRDVALKLLPDAFARDPERLARFQREARLLASLNHPHIAQIYGLEETSGAIVMELVEGPTLADRLTHGRIPLDEALPLARQIAEALEAAHEHGVIHRDLKPANVKVKEDGTIKVLDFGLAKALQPAEASSDFTNSPTITSPAMTQQGVILGTAAYMAPEQAKGRPADKRSDMWAFGCVLYEMLAGKRPFDGDDVTDVLGAVVRLEPDWEAVPADAPLAVRTLLRTCLQKDRRKRTVDAATALFVLDNTAALVDRPGNPPIGGESSAAPAPLWRRTLPVVVAVLVTAAAAGYTAWRLAPEATRPVGRFVITLPADERFTNLGRHAVAVSPSGSHIVYNANLRLNVRAIDQLAPAPVGGTEAASVAARSPFFSPDGQWIGFWADGHLKKVSISGGAPVTLCAADNPWGVSWGDDDVILFGQGARGIMRVSGSGGTPEVVITVETGESAHGPQMLPGKRAVLFTLKPQGTLAWDDAHIVMQSLDTGVRKVLIRGGTDARYVATGHLIYLFKGELLAVPFDAQAGEVAGGAPTSLVESVARAPNDLTGAAHFSLSADGMLVYISAIGQQALRALTWVDRQGRETPIAAPARSYLNPRLSPDGARVSLSVDEPAADVWIWHLTGETLTRLTLDPGQDRYGIWTPDGRRIIYSATRTGTFNLYAQAADGTGVVERLTESPMSHFPMAVSPDGASLVVREAPSVSYQDSDLLLMPLDGARRLVPLVKTPFSEGNAEISPNGRWMAYESNENGRNEIYVRPFPNVNEGRWLVSADGGAQPRWAPSGHELFFFYLGPNSALMSAPVSDGPPFKAGTPVQLFETASYYRGQSGFGRSYDVSPDGRRFLMIKSASAADQAATPASITVVTNWFEELKRTVPVSR